VGEAFDCVWVVGVAFPFLLAAFQFELGAPVFGIAFGLGAFGNFLAALSIEAALCGEAIGKLRKDATVATLRCTARSKGSETI